MGDRTAGLGLFVDLYELTMMQSYFIEGENDIAVFDFYIRWRDETPRRYYVFAGLEYLLEFILNLSFSEDDISYIRELGLFREDFIKYLRRMKFEGEIWAVEEGRIVFPYEPLVEIVAPLPQAQFIETALLNLLQFSILVATKAARCYSTARGKMLVDFGARRAHSIASAEMAARASYITGFNGTSLLSAGKKYGIPVYGTMAHSYVMIHDSEIEAFEKFAKLYDGTVLLVDTYDTIAGVKNAVYVIKKLREKNIKVRGIRLDSGDIKKLSDEARKILDKNGLYDVSIFVSGGINEYKIREILECGGKVDGFGVGTELTVSADLPYLDCAYKLVEYRGKPRIKLSEGKKTIPARKNFKRLYRDGKMIADLIFPYQYENDIELPNFDIQETMMKKVFGGGKLEKEYEYYLSNKKEYIIKCRDNFMKDFSGLPDELKELDPPTQTSKYPVIFTKSLRELIEQTEKLFS